MALANIKVQMAQFTRVIGLIINNMVRVVNNYQIIRFIKERLLMVKRKVKFDLKIEKLV